MTPSPGHTEYSIVLKNGAEFNIGHYWYERGQIRFYLNGGIVGFSRSRIRDLRKIEEKPSTADPRPETGPQASAQVRIRLPGPKPGTTAPGAAPDRLEALEKRMKLVQSEIGEALQAYQDAMEAGDAAEARLQQKRIMDLQDREAKLRQDALGAAAGNILPPGRKQ